MPRFGREEPEGTQGPPADPVEVAREIALRQLTAKARTRAELEKAMAKRGVPEEAAEAVLDRFTELRLIDDAAYAQAWAEGLQRRQKSKRVLAQELRRKGVDDEIIDEALEGIDDADEYAAALALARKKAAAMRDLEPQVRNRRLAGALARRGFSSAVVYRAIREATDTDPDENGFDD